MNETKIKIKDGAIEKTFSIKKFTALQSFLFINKIITIIASSKIDASEEDKNAIISVIKNITKVDNTTEKNESDEVKHIDINQFLPTITTIIKGAIANTDEDTRNDVYNTLLSQVDYINGVSVKSLNLYNVDEFIDDFSSIFKLIFESIKHNFSFFLKEKM